MLLHVNDIIQPPSSFFFNLLVRWINFFNGLLEKINIHYKLWLIKDLEKKLESQYLKIVGLTSVVEEECSVPEDAKDLLDVVRKSLKGFREAYDLLESVQFFNRPCVKENSEKILDAIHDLELIVRKKAHKGKRTTGTSPEAAITLQLQQQAFDA
jgi:hypothetical protein